MRFAAFAVALITLSGCATVSSSEDIDAMVYTDCEALNSDFEGGVSKISANNSGPLPLVMWTENDAVYLENERLDLDRDGIACEVTKLSNSGIDSDETALLGIPFEYDVRAFPEEIQVIFETAWADAKSHSYPGEEIPHEIIVDPDAPDWHVNLLLGGLEEVMVRYAGWVSGAPKIFFIVSTSLEHTEASLNEIATKVGADSEVVSDIIGQLKDEQRLFVPQPNRRMKQALPWRGSLGGHEIQLFESWPEYQGHPFDPHVTTHEIWHPITDGEFGLSRPVRLGDLPCWYLEGQASFIGDIMGIEDGNFSNYIAVLMSHGGGTRSEANSWIGNMDNRQNGICPDTGEYQDGDVAFTLLVGLHGWAKSVEFTDLPPALSWQEHWENVYGFSVEDFYAEAEPLMKTFQSWAVTNQNRFSRNGLAFNG